MAAMKIFPLNETTKVSSPEHGEFEAGEDGGFDLPDAFAHFLHGIHIGGEKAWETDGERSLRILAEETERRRDPATLLAAVEALLNKDQPTETPAPDSKKASPAAKKAAEAPTPAQ